MKSNQYIFLSCILVRNIANANYFEDQAILAPTLEIVERVNDFVLSMIPGDSKTYLSSDTPCKSDEDYQVQSDWFTSEFLNDAKCAGIPNHRLTLKVGVHVMLCGILIKQAVCAMVQGFKLRS